MQRPLERCESAAERRCLQGVARSAMWPLGRTGRRRGLQLVLPIWQALSAAVELMLAAQPVMV